MPEALRAYGASTWSRAGAEFDLLVEELEHALPEEHKREFGQRMQNRFYQEQYQLGYEEGRRAGADEAFRSWLTRIERLGQILASALDPELLAQLVEGALDTYRAPVGTPVSEETRRRFEAALWFRELNKLRPLLQSLDKGSFFDLAGLTVAEVVRAMRLAGKAWVAKFYALTGRPREQGYHAGKLIGMACAEVLVAAIEEVAVAGAGQLIRGTRAAERIEALAEKGFRKPVKRPSGLDDAVAEAAESALPATRGFGPITATVKAMSDQVSALLKVLRARLGGRFPAILDLLDAVDWEIILQHARAVRGKMRQQMLKGYMAERLYRHLPKFAQLRQELLKGLKGRTQWAQRVEYEHLVTTAAAEAGERQLQVTDGLLVAYAANPRPGEPKVLILAVFESKSPSGIRKLVREAKKKGEPSPWAGQFHADLERLSELPVTINGVRYEPHEVVISRRETKWIAVLTKDNQLTQGQLTELKGQGFVVEPWHLPVTDGVLNRVADEVLRAVRN